VIDKQPNNNYFVTFLLENNNNDLSIYPNHRGFGGIALSGNHSNKKQTA